MVGCSLRLAQGVGRGLSEAWGKILERGWPTCDKFPAVTKWALLFSSKQLMPALVYALVLKTNSCMALFTKWWLQLRPDVAETKDDGCQTCKWNWAGAMQHSEQSAFTQGIPETVSDAAVTKLKEGGANPLPKRDPPNFIERRLHDREVCACSKCLLSEAEAIHEDDVACSTLVCSPTHPDVHGPC